MRHHRQVGDKTETENSQQVSADDDDAAEQNLRQEGDQRIEPVGQSGNAEQSNRHQQEEHERHKIDDALEQLFRQ
ncbi:MAG: hypothetical protein U5O39_13755 [Gammaproteobacteria bacterium]|nr:hypothetical protein [Gammaproteobacteria bacterium]